MKKYIILFLIFTILATVVAIALLLIAEFDKKASEYGIDLIIVAIASIITAFFFIKDKKRAPAQNESMIYLISIIIILIIASIAFAVYRLKPFVDSGELVLTKEFINTNIAYFITALIKYILAIYLPFYLACKLLARKYR
ncbi:MAG: ABZJ_00895 family protein [Campylobacteraceae bacterium]|jgi:hypothetical protein|nr:ABZJ_00895 family protein [Campylobacteraceae bacterium]